MRHALRFIFVGMLFSAGPAQAEPPRPMVRVVPLGAMPAAEVKAVVEALPRILPVRVTLAPRQPLPKAAWYAPRRRYRAEIILDVLARSARPGERILALTAVDISTTSGRHADWGVFGLGQLGGSAAVISRYRLKRKARNAAQVRQRVVNTAVHEVGHTLGLDHCTEPRCVMLDAEGSIANTDTTTGRLGPQCAAQVSSR